VLGSQVILWEPHSDHRSQPLYRLEQWPRVRFNDARTDKRGSLWIGSMHNNVNPDGSAGTVEGYDGMLYRLDPDNTITEWCCNLRIANTLAWSPDDRHFYFVTHWRTPSGFTITILPAGPSLIVGRFC